MFTRLAATARAAGGIDLGTAMPMDISPALSSDDPALATGEMLAAVYRTPGTLQIERVPVPRPGPGEMLVRIEACGLCGTDLKKIEYGLQSGPRIFGHEMAGVVSVLGPGVARWRTGDRVALFHHVACGSCFYCQRGLDAQCPAYKETVTTAGFAPAGGGLAQYVLAQERTVTHGTVPIPPDVSFEEAAFIEPVNTCLKGVRRLESRPGDVVAVFGLGPIGLMLAMLLSRAGCRPVPLDPAPDRRENALRLGLPEALDPASADLSDRIRSLTGGRGADAAIAATPALPAIAAAVECVRPGGRVLLFANTRQGETCGLDVGSLCSLEKQVVGSYSSSMDLIPEAAELVFTRQIPTTALITHRFPLSQIQEALATALHPSSGTLKVMVLPNYEG